MYKNNITQFANGYSDISHHITKINHPLHKHPKAAQHIMKYCTTSLHLGVRNVFRPRGKMKGSQQKGQGSRG